MKKVQIEWIDSKSGGGIWRFLDDIDCHGPTECTTLGFIVKDEPDYKVVAQTDGADQVHNCITIPTVCIKRIRTIRTV
ncbi:MAG: hypothetical protein LLF76_02690 [Planctomycetaceae bacterium]|nr:hypothetical protein [Planctomycetaceae bacterium]